MGVGAQSQRYSAPTALLVDHRLGTFESGNPALDTWLKLRALGNEGRASRTYVVQATTGLQSADLAGYYALATGAAALRTIHRKHRHDLPDPVPVVVLGRLAVDRRHQGRGLGTALLRDAMRRTLEVSRSAGVRMLMVHAIDEAAAAFYRRHDFHAFPAGERTLYLPIEDIVASL